MPHTAKRPLLEDLAASLMDVVSNNAVQITIGQTYALADAEQAHRDMEGRKTTGSTVLLP